MRRTVTALITLSAAAAITTIPLAAAQASTAAPHAPAAAAQAGPHIECRSVIDSFTGTNVIGRDCQTEQRRRQRHEVVYDYTITRVDGGLVFHCEEGISDPYGYVHGKGCSVV
ncbi:hypothetical protein [Nonomuraea zeae]|uniref:Secreted protein n=1 Tax=Nonomuraea zeae TaxID=1642303 RepID=A0A5S4FY16_9ACTN|nr:hypothetical protein [Nonomuraea zeae]TMR25707.1 hypothetical protein ETD85_45075 [Nonomuraea zeae]